MENYKNDSTIDNVYKKLNEHRVIQQFRKEQMMNRKLWTRDDKKAWKLSKNLEKSARNISKKT